MALRQKRALMLVHTPILSCWKRMRFSYTAFTFASSRRSRGDNNLCNVYNLDLWREMFHLYITQLSSSPASYRPISRKLAGASPLFLNFLERQLRSLGSLSCLLMSTSLGIWQSEYTFGAWNIYAFSLFYAKDGENAVSFYEVVTFMPYAAATYVRTKYGAWWMKFIYCDVFLCRLLG